MKRIIIFLILLVCLFTACDFHKYKISLVDAAFNGNKEAIEYNLHHGKSPNQKDKSGNTPFIAATLGKHQEIMFMLKESGADINAMNNEGLSALFLAILSKDKNLVKTLIDLGVDVNIYSKEKDTPFMNITPLMQAIIQKDVDMVKLLIKSGANVNSNSPTELSPLTYAFQVQANTEQPEIIDALIKAGANPYVLLRTKECTIQEFPIKKVGKKYIMLRN